MNPTTQLYSVYIRIQDSSADEGYREVNEIVRLNGDELTALNAKISEWISRLQEQENRDIKNDRKEYEAWLRQPRATRGDRERPRRFPREIRYEVKVIDQVVKSHADFILLFNNYLLKEFPLKESLNARL